MYIQLDISAKEKRTGTVNALFKSKVRYYGRAACSFTEKELTLCNFFWEFSEQLFFRAVVSRTFLNFSTKLRTSSCDIIYSSFNESIFNLFKIFFMWVLLI